MRRPRAHIAILWAATLVGCSGGLLVPARLDGSAADAQVFPAEEAPVEVARIVRGGTNYGGLTVVVYSDASAVRTWEARNPDAVRLYGTAPADLPPGSPEVSQFLQDFALVDDVSAIDGPPTCPGASVSYGTSTYVTVGEKTGGNVQCPDAPTPEQAALCADCVALTH